jgi:hypothetical protein
LQLLEARRALLARMFLLVLLAKWEVEKTGVPKP